MDIAAYLTRTIEEYLIPDLDSMLRVVPRGATGGCVYPILSSTIAGAELLGGLLSLQPLNRESGGQYFLEYWQTRLYPHAPRRHYANLVYQLGRHGIAHGFAIKGPVHIFKDDPARHLVEAPGPQPTGCEIYPSPDLLRVT